MTEIWFFTLAFGVGCILGCIFYGGLWWTVKKALHSSHPALWFFTSFWVRMGICFAGFYLVANGDWKKFIVCLLGIIAGRIVISYLTRENNHAN